MAAVIKSNIRRFINEKHDCVSSSDFVQAAKSTGHLTVMECRLSNSSITTRSSWQGVKNYNNIEYELVSKKVNARSAREETDIHVRVWRAFGVGPGQTFHWSKLKVSDTIIEPVELGLRHNNCVWKEDSFGNGMKVSHAFPSSLIESIFYSLLSSSLGR